MSSLYRSLRKAGSLSFAALQVAGDSLGRRHAPIALVTEGLTESDRDELLRRYRFFAGSSDSAPEFRHSLGATDVLSMRPLLCFRQKPSPAWVRALRSGVFDVDFCNNPHDGWAWCEFARFGRKPSPVERSARRRLEVAVSGLRAAGLTKSYLFGTGASLERAISRDWSDGYRIVCNTIARDRDLWHHIDPHFVVAGDAIYHFGFTEFARRFRADLAERLRESATCFVYPDLFTAIVEREFAEFSERLIPVPTGRHEAIHVDLAATFALPALGNVLNILLLPLGCTLSRNVFLWGFDGRAPDDNLFWSNSSRHSYPELIDTLQKAHPAFFAHYVPADKPGSYVATFHGDRLDLALNVAERQGWHFVMMHRSWTPTLQKRFRENLRTS